MTEIPRRVLILADIEPGFATVASFTDPDASDFHTAAFKADEPVSLTALQIWIRRELPDSQARITRLRVIE